MTDFELLTPHPSEQLLPETATLGAVHLDVTDGQRSRLFWQNYVGLSVLEETDDRITMGVDGTPLIVLYPGARAAGQERNTGLYHVALHVPTQKELARLAARLYGLRWEHAPTDHTETMATYFSDPDGNGIEITFETPERGNLARGRGSYAAVMADGTVRSGTEPLDVDELLSHISEDDDILRGMASGTRIGHVHVHVNDMDAARRFYVETLGMGDMRYFDRFRMSDFSLATSFVPHAFAVNTWNGAEAKPRPVGTSGLRFWELLVPAVGDLESIADRMAKAGIDYQLEGNDLTAVDPAENPLKVTAKG